MELSRRGVLGLVGGVCLATVAGCSSSGSQQAKLTAGTGDDWFGRSVAVSDDGSTVLVGVPLDDDPGGDAVGSAYVFERSDGSWGHGVRLVAEDGDPGDVFGWSVAISGDGSTAVVGAYHDDEPNGDLAGSAYVFEQSGGTWTQRTKLAADEGRPGDAFGSSVAISGDGSVALCGTSRDGQRAAYVFEQAGGGWTQRTGLVVDESGRRNLYGVGTALAADGSTAVVAFSGDSDPRGSPGSVSVFEQSGDAWTRRAELTAEDTESFDSFGSSVALSGDGSTAVVGAATDYDPDPTESPYGQDAGSAYVFGRSSGTWTQRAKLTAEGRDAKDFFGSSVGISTDGSTVLVGARLDDDPDDGGGSASVFERAGGAWTQRTKLSAADGEPNDEFGSSVALSGDGSTAVVGAREDRDADRYLVGSVYVFAVG